ncbi:unnamed protein product [Closterium sp. NIES-54]
MKEARAVTLAYTTDRITCSASSSVPPASMQWAARFVWISRSGEMSAAQGRGREGGLTSAVEWAAWVGVAWGGMGWGGTGGQPLGLYGLHDGAHLAHPSKRILPLRPPRPRLAPPRRPRQLLPKPQPPPPPPAAAPARSPQASRGGGQESRRGGATAGGGGGAGGGVSEGGEGGGVGRGEGLVVGELAHLGIEEVGEQGECVGGAAQQHTHQHTAPLPTQPPPRCPRCPHCPPCPSCPRCSTPLPSHTACTSCCR